MIKNEWKRLLKNPLLMIVLAAIILIPSIYAGFFLASMWDPYGELDKLPVAVVNLDVPVEYNGKILEVGNDLVENLREDGSLDFHFIDLGEAEEGLRNGSYYMVVTIPEDFSHNAATVTDNDPQKMQLRYETNPATNYVAMKLSESAMTKIELSLNEKVSQTYAESLFEQLGVISDELMTASDGANDILDGEQQLTDGALSLDDGAAQLADGAQALAAGTQRLASGAVDLRNGITSYVGGADRINTGAGQLLSGAQSLNSGAQALNNGAASLSQGTGALFQGVSQLNGGAGTLYQGTLNLASGTAALADGASDLSAGAQALNNGIAAINSNLPALASGVSDLNNGAAALNDGVSAYTAGVGSALEGADQLSQGIVTVSNSVSALAENSDTFDQTLSQIALMANGLVEAGDSNAAGLAYALDQVAANYHTFNTGLNTLNGSMPAVTDGMTALYDGLNTLDGQSETLNNGAAALANGASSLNSAVPALSESMIAINNGAGSLASGAADLAQGASAAATGASAVADGAQAVSEGLDTLTDGIASADNGAQTLASGATELMNGASALDQGASALYSGTSELADNNQTLLRGADSLSSGASDLKDGSATLFDGATELNGGTSELVDALPELIDGTTELRDGLSDGATEINNTSTGTVNARMFSAPVETDETKITTVNDNGHAMAAYMMSVGLWVASLAFCLMYPLTKHDGITSGFGWWLSKASVIYPMAILQAVILVLILHIRLGFEPVRFGKTFAVACLASVAFMSIMYYFNVLLGKVGSFIMLVFMVLQLAGSAGTYPIEISGPLAQGLNKYMPFTYTVTAFRSTIGGGAPYTKSVVVLSGIFLISTILTIVLFAIRGRKELQGRSNLYDWMEERGFA